MHRYLFVAAGATLWGCWSFFLRPAGLSGPENAVIALAVMALPSPFFLRRGAFADGRAVAALVVLGLADAANTGLYFAAVQRGPLAVAVLTHYLAPLAVALVAPWVLTERRSTRALVAAPLTLAGLAMLIGLPREGFSGTTALLGAGSAVFFAVIILSTKAASRAFAPLAITSVHSVVSIAALLLIFGRDALPPALDGSVLRVALGGLVCGLGGTTLFNTGLKYVPTPAAGAITYLEPLTAAILGWVVFGEVLGTWAVLGGGLVLATGVWVASERRVDSAALRIARPEVER